MSHFFILHKLLVDKEQDSILTFSSTVLSSIFFFFPKSVVSLTFT